MSVKVLLFFFVLVMIDICSLMNMLKIKSQNADSMLCDLKHYKQNKK